MADQSVTTGRLPTPASGSVRALLQAASVRDRFEQVMGDKHKAAMFIASLSTLVYAKPKLAECDPNTVIAAALQAAALDLPINENLGFAYLVPYKGQARFQPGYKGIIQLALRTGQYLKLEVAHVLEGEVEIVNRFTGQLRFSPPQSETVVGVLAYLKLASGFEKFVYWPLDKIHAHARHYSQGYDRKDGAWQTATPAMELKTVLSDLLRTWGIMSIEMRQALAADEPTDDQRPANGNGASHAADKAALYGPDEDAPPAPPSAPAEPEPPYASNADADAEIAVRDAQASRSKGRHRIGSAEGGAE